MKQFPTWLKVLIVIGVLCFVAVIVMELVLAVRYLLMIDSFYDELDRIWQSALIHSLSFV